MNFRQQMQSEFRQGAPAESATPSQEELLNEVIDLLAQHNPGMVAMAVDAVAMRHRLPIGWRSPSKSDAVPGQPAT